MPSTAGSGATKIQRDVRYDWVAIKDLKVSQIAQRELNPGHVNRLVLDFDLEKLGIVTVNVRRDGRQYVIDGQHRIEALRAMGWGNQMLECAIYTGLTEKQEADMFLKLNNVLAVNGYSRYFVGITAERPVDTQVRDILSQLSLRVTTDSKAEGAVHCVTTLKRLLKNTGSHNLFRTLNVVHSSYGDFGLRSTVVGGIGRVLDRYGSEINDADLVTRLSTVAGGLTALTSRAEKIREKTKCAAEHAIAAACVDLINGGRPGRRKLRSWWDDTVTPLREHLAA